MLITFLVGNGFDIAAGINTSYKSFYKWYCDQPSASDIIKEFKREIEEDIDNGGETWADFEIGLGQYTARIPCGLEEEFFECYEDAHDKIIEYIKQEKCQFDFSSIESEMKLFGDGLLKFYQELPPKERQVILSLLENNKSSSDTRLQFISFNYTDVLDQCVYTLAKTPLQSWTRGNVTRTFAVVPSVVHTHGTLDEYPILGVNDVSQIANPNLLSIPQFSEIMIKPESVDSIGQLWHESASRIITDSNIVCIYGMSLGNSDAIWWKKLIAWLMDNPTRHLIIYWYTDLLQNNISILKRNREIAKVKDKFISFFDSPVLGSPISIDIAEAIQDRIHVIPNTKRVLKISLKKTAFANSIEEALAKI